MIYRASVAGYEPVPNQVITRLNHTATVNSFGMRGPNTTPMPGPGTFRVLVMGDSVAHGGMMIDDAQTYPALLQEYLRAKGCPAEALNLSAGGWAMLDETRWVRNRGLFGAQVVALTINDGDLQQEATTSAILDRHPSFPSHWPISGLQEVILRYAMPRLGLGPSTSDPGSGTPIFRADNAEIMRKDLATFNQYVRTHGTRLVVVFHERRDILPPEVVQGIAAFKADAMKLGIDWIEPGLKRRHNATALFRDGIHPTVAGNDALARFAAVELISVCETTRSTAAARPRLS